MAHPVLWPKKTFFYPIGNTSAVRLTQELAPGEPADILLLGCGDPRSILFTAYADTSFGRDLDITCCDAEPGVLARNVLLFTLLADDDKLEKMAEIWNIFYHFYLDQSSLDLLSNQCQKLIEMSTDLDTWRGCRYASFLRVCTYHTLGELHRYWTMYAKTAKLPKPERERLRRKFATGRKSTLEKYQFVNTACRSAGPLFLQAFEVVPQHFRQFWETGITSADPKAVAAATHVNPTLAHSVSGEGFNVHYGTHPISGFHLATIFASTNSSSRKDSVSVEDVTDSVKAQFREWCTAFQALLSPNATQKTTIRLFAGDAVAFCHALHLRTIDPLMAEGPYMGAWSGTRIDLDVGEYGQLATTKAPTMFNVIDTSNLTDHLGLLNVLMMTIPILSRTPSSILHTDTLLNSGEDMSGFKGRVCADIPVISLLLDLTPVPYVSRFTTHSNTFDIISHHVGKDKPQFYERVAWKTASLGDHVTSRLDSDLNRPAVFDPAQLARLLFGIYLEMFADEKDMMQVTHPIHYIRRSYAVLLRIVMDRTHTNWSQAMGHLIDLIESDSLLLMGNNNYQDLCCQLHLLGVYSNPMLLPIQPAVKPDRTSGRFQGWKSVPPVVCVVLVIPRSKLKLLENMDPDKVGTPPMQAGIRGSRFQNIFSSIQLVFGKITAVGPKGSQSLILDEDLSGWAGTSPLILSFWMPSWILRLEPDTTSVSFSIFSRSLPPPYLGREMSVFSTKLMDEKHVYLARERPSFSGELEMSSRISFHAKFSQQNNTRTSVTQSTHKVVVTLDGTCKKVAALTVRVDITEAKAQLSLSNGAAVAIKQTSPCVVTISFGEFEQLLAFPFPINGSHPKVRIARKSLYIEVDVSVSGPGIPGGFSLRPFPIILRDATPTLWNIHYLNMDRLPALNIKDPAKLEWLTPHLSLMFSDQERATQATLDFEHTSREVLFNIKESIASIFQGASGIQGHPQCRVFALTESDMGIYMLIFLNDLRLDLASHSVIADVSALPLTENLMPVISKLLPRLTGGGPMQINTIPEETKGWAQLLPTFTERCRDWKHKANCEYLDKGMVPISLAFSESPICGCGKGQGIPSFSETREWKELVPFVTRAAIGPLFAVSYLDSVGGYDQQNDTGTKGQQQCDRCGGLGKPRLLLCGQCKKVRYCSPSCQKEDWKTHKARCHAARRSAGQ